LLCRAARRPSRTPHPFYLRLHSSSVDCVTLLDKCIHSLYTRNMSSLSEHRKLKAILFDVDGTMADTDVFHRRVYKHLLKPFGIDCTDEFYNLHLSGKENSQLHRTLVPHLSKEDAKKFFEDKESRFRELSAAELEPIPGLLSMINVVQTNGILLAAVSNAPRPNVAFMLELFGVASEAHPISHQGCKGRNGHFDTVVLGEDCVEAKPSPVPYQLAMERLGVRADECIVFEDSESGASAGVRAGCVVVGVLTTKTQEQMRKLGCSYVIRDYTEIDVDKMMREMRDFVRPAT